MFLGRLVPVFRLELVKFLIGRWSLRMAVMDGSHGAAIAVILFSTRSMSVRNGLVGAGFREVPTPRLHRRYWRPWVLTDSYGELIDEADHHLTDDGAEPVL